MTEGNNEGKKLVLFESKLEEAAGKVAERALNDTWTGTSGLVSDVFGGLIGDRIKLWRTRNLVHSLSKTYDFLIESGVNIDNAKSLPMGELYGIFEGASRTDDPDLCDMWSALLANSMDPNEDTFTDPSFVRLLNELSGLDARILVYFYSFDQRYQRYKSDVRVLANSIKDLPTESAKKAEEKKATQFFEAFRLEAEQMRSDLTNTTTEEHISYSISNLARLGVVDMPKIQGRASLLRVHQDLRSSKVTILTDRLEEELADLRRRIGFGFANDKKLPKVASDPSKQSIPTPGYNLTDYGKRFMDACTRVTHRV